MNFLQPVGLEQGSIDFCEIGPLVNIENSGRVGYNILLENYINNNSYYMGLIFNIVNICELIL